MLKTLLEITKPDEFNFISPSGLGDTMHICALKSAIEKRYQGSVHLIIKPTHKVVMYMYDIDNYSVHQFTNDELFGIAKNNYHPQKGRLYVANPDFSDKPVRLPENIKNFLQFYPNFFHLDQGAVPLKPLRYPQIEENIAAKFPNLDNAVLLLPDAHATQLLKRGFWENLARELREKGFTVLQNCAAKNHEIEGVTALPDDLFCVVAAALSCSGVYSLRNGLCDLIADKVKHLTVFYPSQYVLQWFYIAGKTIENIVVDMEDKKSEKKWLEFLKKNIKKTLRVIPPFKQLADRFKHINRRIDTIDIEIESAVNRKFAEFYNDILEIYTGNNTNK
jgi:L-rhamnose mutarotase